MSEVEQTKHRLELLKMARELLNEEYINRRAQDHNTWVAQCDELWKTKKIKLPYPAFAPYPTESEIVAKALTLYNFVNPPANDVKEEVEKIDLPTVGSEPTIKEIEAVSAINPINTAIETIATSPWKNYLTPETITEPLPELVPEPVVAIADEIVETEVTVIEEVVQEPIVIPEDISVLSSNISSAEEPKPLFAISSEPTTVPIVTQPTGLKTLLPAWLQRSQKGA